jgi:hypothetical protein
MTTADFARPPGTDEIIGFVGPGSAHNGCECAPAHCLTEAVSDEPRGSMDNIQAAMQLIAAHTLFRRTQ